MKKLVIIGAGGCGREVAWIVSRINAVRPEFDLVGFIDSVNPEGTIVNGYSVLGYLPWLEHNKDVYAVIAISKPSVRKQIAMFLSENCPELRFANILDPTIAISNSIRLGQGIIMYPSVGFSIDASVGDHVILNARAIFGHDVQIGSFCTISTTVDILGNVIVGEGSSIGAKAVILEKKRIGCNAVVGLGSVVVKNVPDNCTVFGNPALII